MTWLDGAPILETAKAPIARRNEIALRMFRVWYVPFYHYGVIHGDPHLGNYTVRAGCYASTCLISAASGSFAPSSCAASSTSTTRSTAAIATSPSMPTEAGASAICRAR